jgi:hypothetical protein
MGTYLMSRLLTKAGSMEKGSVAGAFNQLVVVVRMDNDGEMRQLDRLAAQCTVSAA